jgi:hypothetical protein
MPLESRMFSVQQESILARALTRKIFPEIVNRVIIAGPAEARLAPGNRRHACYHLQKRTQRRSSGGNTSSSRYQSHPFRYRDAECYSDSDFYSHIQPDSVA